MKKWIIPLLLVAAFVYAIVDFVSANDQVQPDEKERTMQATDFSLPALEGSERSLSEEKGKVVIINFWASWCGPCNTEAPHLQAYYEQHQKDVEILGVNVTSKDKKDAAQKFVDEYELTFPILLDSTGDVSSMYGAFTFPTTIIVNRNGEIEHEIRGPLDEQHLEELLQPLIDK